MAQTNINIRIDDKLKQQFDELCEELGLTMTAAVNMFAKAMIRHNGIPFEITLNVPNKETLKAIDDVNKGRRLSKTFDSVNELFEDLDA